MEIPIPNTELDALAYACVHANLRYYTLPDKPGLSKAVITHRNGQDLSSAEAYFLARVIKEKIEYDLNVQHLESLPMPNNVVYTVEEIVDDLP